MTTYTLAYTGQTTNLSLNAYGAAMIAVPLDTTVVDTLELTFVSNTLTKTGGKYATRTIVYTSAGTGPVPDAAIADVLTNLYTAELEKALSSPIDAAPVGVT
jgi:hypothetical protein